MAVGLTTHTRSERRPHVHELDRLRIETALSVVVVHVLMFAGLAGISAQGQLAQDAFVAVFHYTRELFMFVTGLALVYVYFGRPFDWRYFWKRRGIGVLMPYVLWSVLYTVVNAPGHTWHTWQWYTQQSLVYIITGSASYQLYYILMTLQFYLILPLFLWFMGRVKNHPWLVLGISFALQLIVFAVSYEFISGPTAVHTPVTGFIYTYQERFVLPYQFYFILGGMAALYLDNVRAFLARHGPWLLAVGLVAFAANMADYLADVYVLHISPTTATTAFQPVLVVYCSGLILTLGYLSYRSVQRSPAGVDPRKPRHWWWALLADASFGIYLVHALVLTGAKDWLVPLLPGVSPWIVLPVLCIITATVSTAVTILLLRIPVLSRTVGREGPHVRHRREGVAIRGLENGADKVA